MIQLIVEEYCNSCADFEPVANIQPMFANNALCAVQTEVTCRNRRKCQRMMAYLIGRDGSETKVKDAYAQGVADEMIRQCTGGNENGKQSE